MENEISNCRICKSASLTQVIDLGRQVITSRFPKLGDTTTPSTRIRLVMCTDCNLVQLKDTTESSELYEHMYGYRSGINQTMRNHLKSYNDEIQSKVLLKANDYVLDIGSNDATFLSNYPSTLHRIGCDPTGPQFIEYYKDIKLIQTYFSQNIIQSTLGKDTKFKVVSSISMFYDLPDPVKFAKDIYSILDDNGIWTLEQSYVLTMLERNSIDTICHEHLEYYGVKQIKEIMDRTGFKIIDISLNNCNGGSFRIYVAKKESSNYTEAIEKINEYLLIENEKAIHSPNYYKEFISNCQQEVTKLKSFINYVNNNNKKVYIYGASTKGNCLLQFANIDSSYIKYAVERNPLKVGRTTSTGIEIISEETMRSSPPEYLLVLPWHFRDEIIKRETEFLNNGGKLIFPFPTFEIYSNKPSCLITGIDGQIAHYVEKVFNDEYDIYGITNKLNNINKNILKIENNMNDRVSLENIVTSINPKIIIHLASITNTEVCENNPIDTIMINGVVTSYLCDIIIKNKMNCKIFNASSCENYKGHNDYTIQDDDINFKPNSIYSISKTFGHNIIDYYRKKHKLHISNGIIFTTESPLRKNIFLFRKITEHSHNWKITGQVLQLGSLDSYRNINHASDIADAIKVIINHTHGDSYVICNTDNMIKIEDAVIKLYKMNNIELERVDNTFVEKTTKKHVLTVGGAFRGAVTKINGNPNKLLSLGWKPKYSIDDIFEDFIVHSN
jgi:NDP-4-keto-2,6-dideoxyhexose 3-C-methyltransferase